MMMLTEYQGRKVIADHNFPASEVPRVEGECVRMNPEHIFEITLKAFTEHPELVRKC